MNVYNSTRVNKTILKILQPSICLPTDHLPMSVSLFIHYYLLIDVKLKEHHQHTYKVVRNDLNIAVIRHLESGEMVSMRQYHGYNILYPWVILIIQSHDQVLYLIQFESLSSLSEIIAVQPISLGLMSISCNNTSMPHLGILGMLTLGLRVTPSDSPRLWVSERHWNLEILWESIVSLPERASNTNDLT